MSQDQSRLIPYATLLQWRQAYVQVCTQRGLCPTEKRLQECNDYFTTRAKEEGWLAE